MNDHLLVGGARAMAPAGETVVARISELNLNGDGNSSGKTMVGRADMQLGEITQHNVQQLKKLNQCVFPVSYNDKFYKEVVTTGELARLAYFNDIVVGAVCCRYDTHNGQKALYIMTLGTLAPYRRLGIGKLLVEHVFELCEKDPSVEAVFLHVQVSNDTALEFYKRYGFESQGVAEHYYKRIDPDNAYILVKKIERK